MALSDEERKIVEAVEEFFKEAETLEEDTHSQTIDTLYTVLENILNYPYEDEHRIIQMNTAYKLLELIGFENGSNSNIYVLPHDKDLTKALLALETLITKISLQIEVSFREVEIGLGNTN